MIIIQKCANSIHLMYKIIPKKDFYLKNIQTNQF